MITWGGFTSIRLTKERRKGFCSTMDPLLIGFNSIDYKSFQPIFANESCIADILSAFAVVAAGIIKEAGGFNRAADHPGTALTAANRSKGIQNVIYEGIKHGFPLFYSSPHNMV
jgi:hypothetical protein